ncbi:sugar transferase [Vibrio breoganii]
MIKRVFDIISALLSILLLSPLLVIVSILIVLVDRGPIFYTQKRVGLNGKVFKLYKFRSMTSNSSRKIEQTYSSSEGVTSVGKVIRRLKIDELPQVINVLRGDMSIVGPRPCLPDLLESLNEDGKKRLLVRPGLTGLAQINGNIYLSWEDRWKFDREYVENYSFLLDIKIIFNTFFIVFAGEKKGLKK